MSYINNTLPVKIKILKRLYLNNYLLQIGYKQIKTKSKVPLEEGVEYLVEIYQESTMVFKNLQKVLSFDVLEDGYDVFLKTIEDESFYINYVLDNLLSAKSNEEYEFYKTMFFAYSNGVYKFPMIYENKPLFLEIKVDKNKTEVYIYFDVFGKIYFVLNQGIVIKALSEFMKVCEILKGFMPNITCAKCEYKTYQVMQSFKG